MNVLTKNIENRNQVEFVSLEQIVPKDHLLRQIDAAIDFHKIYEFVGDLYCKDSGRPSINPVVLFKIVLIQHIYGICFLRRALDIAEKTDLLLFAVSFPENAGKRYHPIFQHDSQPPRYVKWSLLFV